MNDPWKELELKPPSPADLLSADWSTRSCDFCCSAQDSGPCMVIEREGRDQGFDICPRCAARVLALILSNFGGPRVRLAAVLHELWSEWAKQMEPTLSDLISALPTPTMGREWARRAEMSFKAWKARAMLCFSDLDPAGQRVCLDEADRVLEALGVEMEPGEIEWVGEDAFTSARMTTEGDHDKIQLWNRGGLAGNLVLKKGDGTQFLLRLGLRVKDSDGERQMKRNEARDNGTFLGRERDRLRMLRRGYEAGGCEPIGATGEYLQALQDYVGRMIPGFDRG